LLGTILILIKMKGILCLLVAILLVLQVIGTPTTHDENFIRKGYRFVRGYPGPFGRWGKGVWGKKNLRSAMLGPAGNAMMGNAGNFGGMGGGFGNLGGLGNVGSLGGSLGNLGGLAGMGGLGNLAGMGGGLGGLGNIGGLAGGMGRLFHNEE